jgi:succinate dehydrogenase flavin-adding protein (antitoxin of CptAB toxin-antitoxin module)
VILIVKFLFEKLFVKEHLCKEMRKSTENKMNELKEVLKQKDNDMMMLLTASAELEVRLRKSGLFSEGEILKIEEEISVLIKKYKTKGE